MLPPECEAALEQLDSFRRGELAEEDLRTLQSHLDACRRCLAYNAQEAALLERLLSATRNCTCPEEIRATISVLLAKESSGN